MTPEQKLNKYYLKTFGWTLTEVEALFASQGNVCAACGRPPGERRLSLDHDHRFDKVKIIVHKSIPGLWFASNSCDVPDNLIFGQHGKTQAEAKEFVRINLRRRSVRSALCLRCNKGLQMFEDSKAPLSPSERLIRLARILENFKVRPPICSIASSLSDKESHEKDNRMPNPADPSSGTISGGNQA